jgi:hypothetical protein
MNGIEKIDRKFKKSENQLQKSKIIAKINPKSEIHPKVENSVEKAEILLKNRKCFQKLIAFKHGTSCALNLVFIFLDLSNIAIENPRFRLGGLRQKRSIKYFYHIAFWYIYRSMTITFGVRSNVKARSKRSVVSCTFLSKKLKK